MSRPSLIRLFCLLCALGSCSVALAASPIALPKAEDLRITADELTHDVDTGWAKAQGAVVVTYGVLTMTAREASINRHSLDFTATGDVRVRHESGAQWQAPSIQGNLKEQTFAFGPFRLDDKVWHLGGSEGRADVNADKVFKNGWISTCDAVEPHYCISAKEIIYRDDGSFKASRVTLRFWDVPVFYFPSISGNAFGAGPGLIVQAGYSGRRGAYARVGKLWRHAEEAQTSLYADLMSRRGVALGLESDSTSADRELHLLLYGLIDQDPTENDYMVTVNGQPERLTSSRRFAVEKERFRVNPYYRQNLAEGLSLRLQADYLSDIDMLEDWFRRDYRNIHQPKSFADLSYDHRWFSLSLHLRPRLNDFYTVVETLPELRLQVPGLQLGHTPFVYKSDSTLGYYQMKWRNVDYSRRMFIPIADYLEGLHDDPEDYASLRADTLHTLSMPLHLGDALVFTPRASFRATSYSRTSRTRVTQEQLASTIAADSVDDPASLAPVFQYDRRGGSEIRLAGEFGAELKSRGSSDWFTIQERSFKHVVEPYVNYTFAPEPTLDRDHITFFDEIDRLDEQNFFRIGVDQRLLTRDEAGVRTLLSLQSYADAHLIRGEETGEYWGDLGNRLEVSPRRDLSAWTTLVFDIGDSEIQRAEQGIRFGEKEKLNASLRYIYRNGHLSRSAYSMGSQLIDLTGESSYIKKYFEEAEIISAGLFLPLTETVSVELESGYDFMRNRIVGQSVQVAKILHCWTMVVGVEWDYEEFQAMIMFRLTAFPKTRIGISL